MSDPETVQRPGRNDAGWPIDENVLLCLSEHVRPTVTDRYVLQRRENNARAVATAVRACLAERVEPTLTAKTALLLQRADRRRRPSERDPRDEAVVLASKRTQTRLMAVRSQYPADSKYYASDAPHVSRTVEELSSRWAPTAAALDSSRRTILTYTLGTVFHDGDTGTCHLRGMTDPRCRVTVDCCRLVVLPRHGSAVKMFSELRGTPKASCTDEEPAPTGPAVLVPHHFQVFSAAADAVPQRSADVL